MLRKDMPISMSYVVKLPDSLTTETFDFNKLRQYMDKELPPEADKEYVISEITNFINGQDEIYQHPHLSDYSFEVSEKLFIQYSIYSFEAPKGEGVIIRVFPEDLTRITEKANMQFVWDEFLR